ncbi:endonuclease III [Gluconobacter sp. LMG 1745]|uniref:Endonuclease III n=2 Tax=Acetobacteraceae TaxID=433 RepID=A0ABR9YWS7_9PROT|nr:endonuclease III [Gluconobacter cadivus]
MSKAAAKAFITALAEANPDAESELVFRNPFELLVSVVLSAQATDKSVNKATKGLFEEAPDPTSMAAIGEEGIARHIRTIGLWRAKAHNVDLLCHQLLERHDGQVPSDRASLEALAGVGRKTANVVMNVAFGADTMAVDTHIFRIGNRTGLAPGKTVRQVEDGLVARIPKDMLRPAHHWLILHGRYVCKARVPECWRCPATTWCLYPDKRMVAPSTRKTATA